MTLGDLLGSIGQQLTEAGIPYMVTGSVASSFHGEPRATRDLDIVIDPSPAALQLFLAGAQTFFATAEDTIIAKLEWAQASGSERQLRDVEAMLTAAGDQLDGAYLDRWISQLGLEEIWSTVQRTSRPS